MTRAQIIDLIKQYIYTNGNQRITAAQLQEILLEIANAFAMEGGGATGGIDSVLAVGSTVTNGREITNEHGGKVLLSSTHATEEKKFNYLGFDSSLPQYQSFLYVGDENSVIGAVKRSDPSRNIFNMVDKLRDGEFIASTQYAAESPGEEIPAGIISSVRNQKGTSYDYLGQGSAGTYIDGSGNISSRAQEANRISNYIQQAASASGPQSSSHIIQDADKIDMRVTQLDSFYTYIDSTEQVWGNYSNTIGKLNKDGIQFYSSESSFGVRLAPTATGGILTSSGMSVLKIQGYSINLEAFNVSFMDGGVYYANFTKSGSTLSTSLAISHTGFSSSLNVTHNGTGNNVAIYANSINGTTNTAVLVDNGNMVVKNGSGMFGFGDEDITPDAKVDIKAPGTALTDLALRVRNSADSKNIVEVAGSGAITVGNGTVPGTSSVDSFRLYAADQAPGNAVPHFRTESGPVIKIYQETTGVGAATLVGGSGTTLTDTDTFDGYTLKQIVKALRNLGLLN